MTEKETLLNTIESLRKSLAEVCRQNDELLDRLDEIHHMSKRRN